MKRIDVRLLDDWVFGAPAAPYRRRGTMVAVYVGMFLAGTAIALFRVDPKTWNLFWAEDGFIFLRDAYAGHGLTGIITPYNGYVHLVPRVLSLAISALPVDVAALACCIAASAVWSAVALVTFDFARGHVRSPGVRAALWLAILVAPLAGMEVAGNLANLHWFLMVGAFWALAARDRGALQIVVASIAVACSALSDPLTLAVLPLILLRALLLRSWRSNIVSIVAVGALGLQLIAVASTTRGVLQTRTHPGPISLVRTILERDIAGGLLGRFGTDVIRPVVGTTGIAWVGGALLVAILVACVLVLRRSVLPVIAVVFSLGFSAVTIWLTWDGLQRFGPDYIIIGASRYSVTSSLALYSALAIVVSIGLSRILRRSLVAQLVVGALIPVLLVGWVQDYRQHWRSSLPDAAVQFAQHGCSSGGEVRIQVLPVENKLFVEFPCDRFASASRP